MKLSVLLALAAVGLFIAAAFVVAPWCLPVGLACLAGSFIPWRALLA